MSTYYGYENYETYCVGMHIDNDEYLYRNVRRMAMTSFSAYTLANEIESLVRNEAPSVGGMYEDLLTSAIDNVNFEELAKDYLEE